MCKYRYKYVGIQLYTFSYDVVQITTQQYNIAFADW